MQLSTRGRYAVMAMVDLASRQSVGRECGPVCLAEIAASQNLSLSYLEQLFARLRRGGLVASRARTGRRLPAGARDGPDFNRRHHRRRRRTDQGNAVPPMKFRLVPGLARSIERTMSNPRSLG